MILQILLNSLVSGSLYALVALGFGLVYNTTRIFHIAYGAIFVASSYLFYTFYSLLHLHIALSILITLICTVLIGIFIHMVIYRPLERQSASPDIIVISSLALYLVLVNIIALIFGNEPKVVLETLPPKFTIGQATLNFIQLGFIISFLVTSILLFFSLKKTLLGKTIRALRDNPQLLIALGINLPLLRLAIFLLSSFICGICGVLHALDSAIDPHMGMSFLLIGMVAVIVGGVGNLLGSLAGGILLGALSNLIIWKISGNWVDSFVFLLLFIFLLIRPYGILARRRRVEEL
jgi:branched-chain amino acid transport system permease protein